MAQEKKKPANEIRRGCIKAAIWANQFDNGAVRHNATLVRLYKDGDRWKESTSFRREDLPLVSLVSDLAYAWMWEHDVPANPDQADE